MVDIQGEGPYIVEWNTSRNKRSEEMYAQFKDQCGAYALGLTSLTGIQPKGAAIVVARRSGEPEVKIKSANSIYFGTAFMGNETYANFVANGSIELYENNVKKFETTTSGVSITGSTTISSIANASSDTDKFLVSESGVGKYRTGAQLRSDIGA